MTIKEIANRWVELVRLDYDETAIKELYSPDIESIENNSMQNSVDKWQGLEGKKEKNKMWYEMVNEVHEIVVSEPIVADRAFACSITMDVTYKDDNWGRQKMSELAVLEIRDGKIVHEEYIY